jgi:hypothetical protein
MSGGGHAIAVHEYHPNPKAVMETSWTTTNEWSSNSRTNERNIVLESIDR